MSHILPTQKYPDTFTCNLDSRKWKSTHETGETLIVLILGQHILPVDCLVILVVLRRSYHNADIKTQKKKINRSEFKHVEHILYLQRVYLILTKDILYTYKDSSLRFINFPIGRVSYGLLPN